MRRDRVLREGYVKRAVRSFLDTEYAYCTRDWYTVAGVWFELEDRGHDVTMEEVRVGLLHCYRTDHARRMKAFGDKRKWLYRSERGV